MIRTPEPVATALYVRRKPDTGLCETAEPEWALEVHYHESGNEHCASFRLPDEITAVQVDALYSFVQHGDRLAALDLFACLHDVWGRTGIARRHPAWDAVFRHLGPMAAGAA